MVDPLPGGDGSRRIQQSWPKNQEIIAYRLQPVYRDTGMAMVTAALMMSMISGRQLSTSGGGGDYLSVEEYEVLLNNKVIRDAIIQETNKPKPKIIDVVVVLQPNASLDDVLTDLKAQGFALKNRGMLGRTPYYVGEIYDTYLGEAKAIDGVEDIQLKSDVKI
jgi:hypothetical protein